MRWLPIILLLTACDVGVQEFAGLSPEECRAFGVAVHDNTVPTGTIVRSEFGTFAEMRRHCTNSTSHSRLWSGCAKPTDKPYEFEIYYADRKCVAFHEACHALYMTRGHTTAFVRDAASGNWLASCP